MNGYKEPGEGSGSNYLMGTGFFLGGDGDVLEVVVVAAQHCQRIKCH